MTTALIGHSGFVGSTLLRQSSFDHLYRASTIAQIEGGSFDMVVCAGAPAQKWIANRAPEQDRSTIDRLMAHLDTIRCGTLVLVSTVDVFASPVGVDETSPVDETGLHAYGQHRRMLEHFVAQRFPEHLIVRLPGLVGPGLRKNAIYDLHHGNNVQAIDSRGVFQFYPMVNLWFDLRTALQARLRLLHLTAAPVSMAEVAREGFGIELEQHVAAQPARYDMQSVHAALFGGQGRHQYGVRDTLQAIRAYAQSEPRGAREGGPQ